MQGIRTVLDKVLTFVCVALFVEMTIVGAYQIITRYFFNSPSTVSEEIVTYSFTWLSILSAALVFGKRGHLCMTFFSGKFTGSKKLYLDIFSEITVVLMAVLLLIYGGYIMAMENIDQTLSALVMLTVGEMYIVLPLSGVIICIYGLLNLADLFKVFKSPDLDNYGVKTEV